MRRSGFGLVKRLTDKRVAASAVTAAMVVSALTASSVAAATPEAINPPTFAQIGAQLVHDPVAGLKPSVGDSPEVVAPTDSDDDGVLDAPDTFSATVGAKGLQKPVEDFSQRTETTTTSINPDGSRTLRQYQSPVRVKRDGTWLEVDPTLVKQADGTFKPRVSATDVVIGAGGSTDAGTVTFDDGRSVAVTWPEQLPEPSIDGGVATYKLSEAVDLLMIVAGDGMAARLRLNKRPADDDPVFTFGLRTHDLKVSETEDGSLELKDDRNEVVGETSKLVAWDARTDEAGRPLEKVELDASLDQTSRAGDVATHDLELSTPDGFLTDPDTKFPVIIDPDVNGMIATSDTWVREGDSTDHSDDTDLVVGRSSAAANAKPAIAFMQWNLDRIPAGSSVVSASLNLHQWFAGSCSPTSMAVQPLAEDWGATGLTFPDRPQAYSTHYEYITENKGYQCGNAGVDERVSASATVWVTNWLANRDTGGGYPPYGLRLGVPQANEDDIDYQRRFCSYHALSIDPNCADARYEPSLAVTYNKAPATPAQPVVTSGGNPVTIYTTVSDSNHESSLRAVLTVTKASTGAQVWQGYTNAAVIGPNGSSEVSARVPFLPDGDYKVTATSYDDLGFSSGVSAEREFSVDTDFGSQSWYSTTPHPLSDRSSLEVNNRTGNLSIRANDISVNGQGLNLDVTRYFNSQSVQTNAQGVIPSSERWYNSMGAGWSLGVGPDVWMQKRGDNFWYHAPGGTVFGPFTPKPGSNDFDSPKGGVGANLSKNSEGDNYTLKFRKSQIKYEFTPIGSEGHLFQSKISDRNEDNNTIVFDYGQDDTTPNGRAKLNTITDASGRVYTVEYTGDYITRISEDQVPATQDRPNPLPPRVWQYIYGNDYLGLVADPTGRIVAYQYAASAASGAGVMTKITEVNETEATYGNTIATFDYYGDDANLDRVKTAKYQKDASSTVDFGWSYARRSTGDSCKTSDNSADGSDYATTVTDAKAADTTYCFKNSSVADGGRVRVYDALNNVKTTSYTADKGTASISTPMNEGAIDGSTVATYSSGLSDQLDSITEPRTAGDGSTPGTNGNKKTSFAYDHQANNDSASSSAPAGGSYLPAMVKTPNGTCSAYEYDDQGRTTAAYTGLQYTATTECDKTDEIGFHRRYNDDGTVKSSWDANAYEGATNEDDEPIDSHRTQYTYWTSNDAPGSKGQLKTLRKPGGSCDAPRKLCTSYTYDQLGRVATMTDGRGKVTTYAYDVMDRTTGVYFNGTTPATPGNTNRVTYAYDENGNLTSRTDAAGTSTFTYDWLGRQTQQNIPGAQISLAYDGNGNLLTHTQTLTGQAAQTTNYTYDAANRLTKVHDDAIGSGGAGDIGISPDSDGRTKQIAFPNTSTGNRLLYANYDFKKSGKPRMANVKDTNDNTRRTYDYDYMLSVAGYTIETDQLRGRNIVLPGTGNNHDITYEYADERIASSTDDNGPNFTYTHDKVGNVTEETTNGTSTYFGYDFAGQLCWRGQTNGADLSSSCGSGPSGSTNFAQDAAGNNTNTATNPTVYNDDSQVTSINGTAMGYLDRGNDLRTTAGATSYINSPLGVTATKTGTDITYYVRDPQGSILASYGAGGTLFYFSEFTGSVAALYNTAGTEVGSYTYSPYGKTVVTGSAGAANPFRYIGGIQDSDSPTNGSSYKLGARYYDAQGHFTQPDSVAGTISNPKTLTSYNYAGGDPINSFDPSGRSLLDIVEKGVELADTILTGSSIGNALRGGLSLDEVGLLAASAAVGFGVTATCGGIAAVPAIVTGIPTGGIAAVGAAATCGTLGIAAGEYVSNEYG